LNLSHFKKVEDIGLKIIASKSPLNGINSLLNFMKIYQAVQKLLVGDTQTDRQTCDFIIPLSFLESRLKIQQYKQNNTNNSPLIFLDQYDFAGILSPYASSFNL
jgi:hypothetical protein